MVVVGMLKLAVGVVPQTEGEAALPRSRSRQVPLGSKAGALATCASLADSVISIGLPLSETSDMSRAPFIDNQPTPESSTSSDTASTNNIKAAMYQLN